MITNGLQSAITGKTTLLMLIAGRFMVDPDMVRVIGRSPFHDLVRPLKRLHVHRHSPVTAPQHVSG